MEQLPEKLPAWIPQWLRVLYFGDADWGFSDAAVSKLQAVFARSDLLVDIWHSGLTIEFFGDEKKEEFERVWILLEGLRSQPEFDRCKLGFAEGITESVFDVGRITREAMTDAKKA